MQRRAFGLIEVLLVVGILGAVTSLSIPLYSEYQIRSDLETATQQTTQGLDRAKLLSQSGERDAGWGFYVPAGVLYKGTSYADRDTAFDEVSPMPSTIAISGLFDVAYSKVEGTPSTTGNIVLRALNNDERTIQVSIAVQPQQLATNESDTLTICHYDGTGARATISIPDATWPTHQSHGDTMGACPGAVAPTPPPPPATPPPAPPASSSSSSSAAGGEGAGGGSCKFTIASDQTITLTTTSSVTFKNYLAQLAFGNGGPYVNVHACYSVNDGSTWASIFGGNGACNSNNNGNSFGNALAPNGIDTSTKTIAAGSQLVTKLRGFYKQHGWLVFNEIFQSDDQTQHILFLRNGAALSNYPVVTNQVNLRTYLISKGMLNAQGIVTIGACEVLSLGDFNDPGTSGADYQDDVMLLTFN